MKLKSFLQRVYPSPSVRGRRSSDFQPLGSSDFQNFENVHQSTTNSLINNRSRYALVLERDRSPESEAQQKYKQPAIELKDLNVQAQCPPCGPIPPKEIQVYNATSEELPSELCTDDGLLASMLNVRLAIRSEGTLGEANDQGNGHNARKSNRTQGCFNELKMLCCQLKIGKWLRLIICIILGLLGCTLLLAYGLDRSISFKYHENTRDSEKGDYHSLMTQNWPLHDIKSRAKNITFDTIAREHLIFHFDENIKHSSDLTYHLESDATIGSNYSGMDRRNILKFNGEIVNSEILNESYVIANKILTNVNVNSSIKELLAWKGLAVSIALQEISRRFGVLDGIHENFEGILPEYLCFPNHVKSEKCNNRKNSTYREINGECNNVIYPAQGAALYSPLRRILKPLPFNLEAPTHEHLKLNHRHDPTENEIEDLDQEASVILPLWGILILHDTLKIADAPGTCCPEDNRSPMGYSDTSDDYILNYARFFTKESNVCYQNIADHKKFKNGTKWMRKCSSLHPPAVYPSCNASELRTTFNLVTSYIDASNVYGSSLEVTEKLREKSLGKLKMNFGKQRIGKGFLPIAVADNATCFYDSPINAKVSSSKCLLSGDPDVHEMSFITALNTILVRQHNWIAFWLNKYNHHWDDERLFQESRKILSAQVQHITFNEFLPAILGTDLMNATGILLNQADDEFYTLYDPEVKVEVSMAFAAVSKLFFYSMLGSNGKMIYRDGKIDQDFWFDMGRLWYRPEALTLRKNALESLLLGFSSLNASRADLKFPSKIRSLHVKFANTTFDLPEILFERGQALEVPLYMEYRKVCGLKELKTLEDFNQTWSAHAFQLLSGVYRHLEEVDLIAGVLAEKPIPSGRVGPTMACLFVDQFLRFKKGDRYWYEGDIYFQHFTEAQLDAIRSTTLARIICDNTENDLDTIQKWPMNLPSPKNPIMSCRDPRIPKFRFEQWKEKVEHTKKGQSSDKMDSTFEAVDDENLLGNYVHTNKENPFEFN